MLCWLELIGNKWIGWDFYFGLWEGDLIEVDKIKRGMDKVNIQYLNYGRGVKNWRL